jgi:DNA-binding NtrC family response regulator
MTPDAHLLIVDDDERIRTLLQKFLIRMVFWYPPPVMPLMHGAY